MDECSVPALGALRAAALSICETNLLHLCVPGI